MTRTYPFYALTGFLQQWMLHEGSNGCVRSPIEGLSVSLDLTPPGMKTPASKASDALEKLLIERNAKASGYFKGVLRQAIEENRIKKELVLSELKPTAASVKTAGPSAPKEKSPVQFDLHEIPAAMRKMGQRKSADLMDQWFSGRLNYSRSKSDESRGIDQDGRPYAPEFVEQQRFTWDWLRKYQAVDKAFSIISSRDYLTKNEVNASGRSAYSEMQSSVLGAVARRYGTFIGVIDTRQDCNDDLMELHRRHQFQHYDLKILSYPNTDLGAALGDFSVYAAIAYIKVERQDSSPHTAAVTHVYLYVKDNYSFTDDPARPSQYLGHWNRTGVVYAPLETLAELAKKIPFFGKYVGPVSSSVWDLNAPQGLDFPVYRESDPELLFYPVHNRDFFNWQMKHRRGGNIVSFSDLKLIRLDPPIRFQIPAAK